NQPRPELLGNLATVERRESPIIVNHYNVQPVFDVLANVQGRDLGGVAGQVNKILDETKKNLPRGTFLSVRGQVENMNKSFAGFTRLRPVMMTALAMIIGMLPFSFGLGEGGEQNAPLGRAVIGGLIFATFATLFFVPVVYSILRKAEFTCDEDEEFERQEQRGREGEQPGQ